MPCNRSFIADSGTCRSSTSSVTAIANTPSLNASVRLPAHRLSSPPVCAGACDSSPAPRRFPGNPKVRLIAWRLMQNEAPRILVDDDEESITQLVSTVLPYEGFDVECAASGRAAVKLSDRFR